MKSTSASGAANRRSRTGDVVVATGPTSSERRLTLATIVLALIGVGIGGYVSYTHFAQTEIICTGGNSCELVQASIYSTVAGIPIAALGLLLYLAIIAASLISMRGGDLASMAGLAVFGLAVAGVGYSAYLTYLELFVLHAICQWCVASAIVITAILALSVWREIFLSHDGVGT